MASIGHFIQQRVSHVFLISTNYSAQENTQTTAAKVSGNSQEKNSFLLTFIFTCQEYDLRGKQESAHLIGS